MVARIKLDAAPEAKIYLAQWRETKFATQQELADAMNTTAAAISRIETGKREWSKGYLEALAYLVGCRVAELFEHPEIVRGSPGKPSFEDLMKMVASMSEAQRAGLVALFGQHKAGAPPAEPFAEVPPARPARAKSA